MTMKEFIKQNKAELRECIGRALAYVPKTASCYCPRNGTDHYHEAPKVTDEDIKEWILSDEGLYRWARSEGVRI